MILKNIVLLFAFMVKQVTITGLVSGDTKGKDYIYYYGKGISDSVRLENGKFIIRIPFSETVVISMVSQYDRLIKQSYRPYYLLIDGKNDIQIDMDIVKGLSEALISGSVSANAYHYFQRDRLKVYINISQILSKIYGKSYVPQTDSLFTKMNISRDSLTKIYMGEYISQFVEKYKGEYVSVFVLISDGKPNMKIDVLEKSLESLSPRMRSNPESKKIEAYIRGVKYVNVGAIVKNFVLKSPEGLPISFSQFKGKYVWIDFWASWCIPCKQAFPHMRELYAKYKSNGFEILGISTDSKMEPWLKILPLLQNPWPQVWDNKNIMSEFAVTALPTSFLIDPNGKIVLKEIGYDPKSTSEMDKKLFELFEANKKNNSQ